MSKPTIKLVSQYHRDRALEMVRTAPDGWHVSVREPTRSLDANARMWAMLSDISQQHPMGRKHTPEDWKAIFCNSCGWEVQFVEGLDGRPFPMGFRTSKMTVSQMSNLLDFISAFGNEHGIRWSEPVEY